MYWKEFIGYLKRSTLLLLTVLYLVAPLKDAIINTSHHISHAISTATSLTPSHHHDEDHSAVTKASHTHEHQVLQFMASLFSSEGDASETHKILTKSEIDKHVTNCEYELESLPKLFKKKQFIYTLNNYTSYRELAVPPPRNYLS